MIDLGTARKYLAYGTGVGIEMSATGMQVAIVRVRPGGTEVLGTLVIAGVHERPAAEWAPEYATFLKAHGVAHVAAVAVVPRESAIVRVLPLPGVANGDLESAIRFQLDGLHPYPEDDVAWTWQRLDRKGSVLVTVVRRSTVLDPLLTAAAETGIALSAVVGSPAAIHPALRLYAPVDGTGMLATYETPHGTELYGESEARPVFSTIVESSMADGDADVPLRRALAEMRLPEDTPVLPLRQWPAYAAALASACPALVRVGNLLPSESRQSSSRLPYAPTIALAAVLALMAVALGASHGIADRRLLEKLQAETAQLQPAAGKAQALDGALAVNAARIDTLGSFRKRSKADLDALSELTRILPPPAWANAVEISRAAVTVSGEADQAAPLLKVIDSSPLFAGSEFTMAPIRTPAGEMFRIQANREGAGLVR